MTNEQLVTLIKNKIDVSDNMLQLWQQNTGIIGKIANTYKGYEDIEDLKQQGYIGLCNAVQGYRPDENIPFINYAVPWIRQSMKRYIENSGSVIRIPSHSWSKHTKYKKTLQYFAMQIGREPTDLEICQYMQISYKELEDMKNIDKMSSIGSLDSCIGDDGDTTIVDLLPDDIDVESIVMDEIEKEELKEMLWSIVDTLPGKQPQVIRSIYQEGNTLKDTGKQIGVLPECVRTIKQSALRELRKSSRKRILIDYFTEEEESMAYRHNGVNEFNRTWTSSTELVVLRRKGIN